MVAMIIRNISFLGIILLLNNACTPYGRLNVQVEQEEPVEFIVQRPAGEEITFVLSKCESAFLYEKGYEISNVEIFVSGTLIEEWSKDEIQEKLKIEDEVWGYAAWIVRNNKIEMSTDQRSTFCERW